MLRFRIFFISIVMISMCSGCSRDPLSNNIIYRNLADSLYWISSWHMLVPLFGDTLSETPVDDYDFLMHYQSTEDGLTDRDFMRIEEEMRKEKRKTFQIQLPMHGIDFEEIFRPKQPVVIYLACNLRSTRTQKAAFMFNSFQTGKLWVNGQPVYQSKWKGTRVKYREEVVSVALKKGNNFVLFKICFTDSNSSINRWRFDFCVSSLLRGKQIYAVQSDNYFLKRSCLMKNDPLRIETGPFIKDTFHIVITDYLGNQMAEHVMVCSDSIDPHISINLPDSISKGLYYCRVHVDGFSMKELFFYGDIHASFENLKNRYASLKQLNKEGKILADAGFFRLETAIDKRPVHNSFESQNEFWNKLRVAAIEDLTQIVDNLSENRNPVETGAGRYRYYTVPSTDSLFYYTSYFPETKEKVPVFIYLYLEPKQLIDKLNDNWILHFKNESSWDYYKEISKKVHAGFVVTNCSGHGHIERQRNHFRHLLNKVKLDPLVDTTRIFLVGNCFSTRITLDFLYHFSSEIAGCGFIHPVGVHYDMYEHLHYPHPLYVLIAYYDEEQPISSSLSFHHFLKNRVLEANIQLEISFESTHHLAPPDYQLKMCKYLLDD